MILEFFGPAAHSAFRLDKLLISVRRRVAAVERISSQYVYFAYSDRELATEEQQSLRHLLPHEEPLAHSDQLILIVPRIGTISPWASKATDIAKVSGLKDIERIERGCVFYLRTKQSLSQSELDEVASVLHDRMTESVLWSMADAERLFAVHNAKPLMTINLLGQGKQALQEANEQLGLALSVEELDYLYDNFKRSERNPSDAELMMFAQVNSEHCRHKIFNAEFVIDGKKQSHSLFNMIRHTHQQHPGDTLSAYSDNAAVVKGVTTGRFYIDVQDAVYRYHQQPVHLVIKVETHNHPTAISPFAGAATGPGGEIRDEAATGRGATTKAGLCGFSVSDLHIPGFQQPWEFALGRPPHFSSALDIMLAGPIGAASFNNEFGRPNLCGYFRTLTVKTKQDEAVRGYHKPIMIAGGLGNIRDDHVQKQAIPTGSLLIVLGGPAMAIGLGGGAASSMAGGASSAELDFASVQRSNPEMQRRAQQVINTCWAMGEANPIVSIHDVGAGGLSNAMPELVHDAERGGKLQLRAIPNAEPGMSPMEIWCNEAQERYVLAIQPASLELFTSICQRERCLFAVIGEATEEQQLTLHDQQFANDPVDLPLSVLFGKPPKMVRDVSHTKAQHQPFKTSTVKLSEAIKRVLQLPCVASKSFLITIGDRTVGGLVARDQMIGPWQVPVADVAVTCSSFQGYQGEAMAMGERTPVALIDHASSARLAVAEALTNIAAAPIEDINKIRLSANWMAAAGYPGEDAGLYDAVKAVAMEFCPKLGISIPVGKDSMSMRAVWQEGAEQQSVTAPLSLIISAFAPVTDVRKTLTPELQRDQGETELLLIDLSEGNHSLGGSALAQVYQAIGDSCVDSCQPEVLTRFFQAIQQLNQQNLILAYHDRSDGGLLATVCEMSFAAHVGVTVNLAGDPLASLFNEALGAVIQIRCDDHDRIMQLLADQGLADMCQPLGRLNDSDTIEFKQDDKVIYSESRITLQQYWAETSYRLQALRDNPQCAEQEYQQIADASDPGLHAKLSFDPNQELAAPMINTGVKPKVAILREQGVNGHVEMAAAFDRAGFTSVDVHMSDIIAARVSLADFKGLAACGGFSYGDVLGAGRGWAKSILMHAISYDEFAAFFQRSDTFTLGVCNGCQMLSQLKEMIPGAEQWPNFVRNQSEQFEARLSLVEVLDSPSILLQAMQGSILPIAVAHGEGRVTDTKGIAALRYVNNHGQATQHYPANPNGSPKGITGLTTTDGRVTIMMPHPERVFRTVQYSWHPNSWPEAGPWLRLFQNAYAWVAANGTVPCLEY